MTKTNKEKDVVLFLFNDLFVIGTQVPRKKKMALKINAVMELTHVIHSAPHNTGLSLAGANPTTGTTGAANASDTAAADAKKECILYIIDNSVNVDRGMHKLLLASPQERDSWAQALQENVIDITKKDRLKKPIMGKISLSSLSPPPPQK